MTNMKGREGAVGGGGAGGQSVKEEPAGVFGILIQLLIITMRQFLQAKQCDW